MRLFIPEIGDKIILTEDWSFNLFGEYRNSSFVKNLQLKEPLDSDYGSNMKSVELTLKKGTILTVDRIYIRKGISDYSSITFNVFFSEDKKIKGRFWSKLYDVNLIEYEIFELKDENTKPKYWVFPDAGCC